MKPSITRRWLAGQRHVLMSVATAVSGDGASDPGVRGGAPGAGSAVSRTSLAMRSFFEVGLEDFEEAEGVADGMGPRFNLDGCAGCHLQPAVGGSFARRESSGRARDRVRRAATRCRPSSTLNGPVREARFKFNRRWGS